MLTSISASATATATKNGNGNGNGNGGPVVAVADFRVWTLAARAT